MTSILSFSHSTSLDSIRKSNEQCIESLVEKINMGIDLLQKDEVYIKLYKEERIEE